MTIDFIIGVICGIILRHAVLSNETQFGVAFRPQKPTRKPCGTAPPPPPTGIQ